MYTNILSERKIFKPMTLGKVPIVPQWNLTNGCVVTPDGGFLYIGSKTVNYISRVKDCEMPVIKVFHIRQPVFSLDIDPTWADDNGVETKYFALLAQDGCVQIWDFDKSYVVSAHRGHVNRQIVEGNVSRTHDKILLSYMCNRNVMTLSSYDMIIYCVASNSFCRRTTFISARNQTLTVLRCSPFNENIFAVGTSRGLVLICDLNQMQVVYTLRGHEAQITSLSWTSIDKSKLWCPPKEIQSEQKEIVEEKKEIERTRKDSGQVSNNSVSGDDIFDIYDYGYLDNEFGAPPIDETLGDEEKEIADIGHEICSTTSEKFDFVEACQNLKEDIIAIKNCGDREENIDEVTLKDCENKGNLIKSNSDEEDDSSEGSLVLENRSSDDEVDVDGTEPRVAKCLASELAHSVSQIMHTVEIHSKDVDEQKEKEHDIVTEEVSSKITENHKMSQEVDDIKINVRANTSSQEVAKDILLASASSDATFWVWNTETGGACDHQRSRGHVQHGKNHHIEVAWLKSTSLLTTNRSGEIIQWNMLSSDKKIKRYKFQEDNRRFSLRGVVAFSICRDNEFIWGISSHREITCENIQTQQIHAKYSCASTNISTMRECPDDMNKIALGFADRRIGVIDVSNLTSTNVSIENFTARIESSVYSLVWSPDSKKLAFGTSEGTVGVINVENSKTPPHIYHPFCGKPIYSMDWQENYIYVVCNEKLGVYEDDNSNKDAEVLHSITNISAVSARKELLFIGTQMGHLRVYRRKQHQQSQQKLGYDLIQDLEISPRYITEIAWSSIARDQCAIVSMANKISILTFNEVSGAVTHLRKIEIKNPKSANACVKWSNRNPNELLTCGLDGAIRVWDLRCNNDEEKFLKQFHCPMTCGVFLPTDENIVICAGKSTSIEFFNMSTEKSEDYSQSKWLSLNAHTLEHVQWALKMPSRIETKTVTAADKRRQRKAKKRMGEKEGRDECKDGSTIVDGTQNLNGKIVCDISANDKNKEKISALMDNLKIDEIELEKRNFEFDVSKCGAQCGTSAFLKIPTTLLYLTTKEINKDALEKLNYILGKENYKYLTKSVITAKLFSRKNDAKELLEEELHNHQKSTSKGIANLIMPQLNYSYKDEIVKCIQNKQLTEWHVSLAPNISYNFWQKCCQAFAEQLLEQGYALQAATYMIAIHNQTEAILMLLQKNYYKEALLIARVYLQPEDPLLNTIPDKWISYLDFTGNFAGAALVCALSGQLNRAYEILSKVRVMQPDVEQALELLRARRDVDGCKQ